MKENEETEEIKAFPLWTLPNYKPVSVGWPSDVFDCLCWGLMTRQALWVIFYHLPEKGRRETEETVEEMKERDRGERKMNDGE